MANEHKQELFWQGCNVSLLIILYSSLSFYYYPAPGPSFFNHRYTNTLELIYVFPLAVINDSLDSPSTIACHEEQRCIGNSRIIYCFRKLTPPQHIVGKGRERSEPKMQEKIWRNQSVSNSECVELPQILSPISTPSRVATSTPETRGNQKIKIIPLPGITPTYAAAAQRRQELLEKRATIARRYPRPLDLTRIPPSARNKLVSNKDRIDEKTRIALPESCKKLTAARKQSALLVGR